MTHAPTVAGINNYQCGAPRGGPRNNDGEVHIQRADAHRKVGFMSDAFYGAPEMRHGYITILVDNMRCGAAGDP